MDFILVLIKKRREQKLYMRIKRKKKLLTDIKTTSNKDLKIYNEQRKKIESELKTIQQDLTALQAKIKTDSIDSSEKVSE